MFMVEEITELEADLGLIIVNIVMDQEYEIS